MRSSTASSSIHTTCSTSRYVVEPWSETRQSAPRSRTQARLTELWTEPALRAKAPSNAAPLYFTLTLSGLYFPAPLAKEAGRGSRVWTLLPMGPCGFPRFPQPLVARTTLPSGARGGAGRDEAGRPEGGGGERPAAGEAAAFLGLSRRPPPRCRCWSTGSECSCRSPPGTSSEPTRFWRWAGPGRGASRRARTLLTPPPTPTLPENRL